MKLSVFFCLFLALTACSNFGQNTDNEVEEAIPNKLDLQGHRGSRGLMPENTIPGFIHALDLGVTTLELDVVITKDHQVICSHEPWFSHEIALKKGGEEILEDNERDFRIFEMSYEETQNFDVGLKHHNRFPNQEKFAITKPLLAEVIESAEQHAEETGRPKPFYNIETKCTALTDSVFHPDPEQFSELLLKVIFDHGIAERTIIQSFDNRTLKYIHKHYPHLKLALLIDNTIGIEQNLDNLGFYPDIYSPDFSLVNEDLVAFCHARDIKVIPWTVNEVDDMRKLLTLGVDGLISDYPNKFKDL